MNEEIELYEIQIARLHQALTLIKDLNKKIDEYQKVLALHKAYWAELEKGIKNGST